MYPLIARFLVVWAAGQVIGRVVQHPKIAPVAGSRKSRLAMLAVGWGLRMHPRTRIAGHAVGQVLRHARRTPKVI
jgi:hypothetical protein